MVRVRFGWATEDGRVGETEVDGGAAQPTPLAIAAALAAETKIPVTEVEVLLNGVVLRPEDVAKLSTQELVLVRRRPAPPAVAQPQSQSGRAPGRAAHGGGDGRMPTAQQIRDHFRSNPELLSQLLHSNPVLAEAVLNDDISVLEGILQQDAMARQRQQEAHNQRLAALAANPFDAELQKQIEEEIRLENVAANYEAAVEHNPESFGRVVMLYIDCSVNGHPLKGFVDSGAQSTIMSAACAQRCGLMRLIDSRFAGVAKGVGTAKILGRVHVAPLLIGKEVFTSSFTILEGTDMDFLLGLDMLRKHQACINLRENVLEIGSQKCPFLAEKDLPHHMRPDHMDAADEPTHAPSAAGGHAVPKGAVVAAPKGAAAAPKGIAVTAPPPAAKPAPQAPTYPEAVVQQLMNLGYPREQVIQALNRFNGNAEMAAALLFESSGMGF